MERSFFVKKNSWSVSRVLFLAKQGACHLSEPDVTSRLPSLECYVQRLYRSTLWHRTSSPYSASLHDLSTSKKHSTCVTTSLVGSYPTFSPLPPEEGGCFLLLYSTLTDCFPLRSGMLCVARTFLLHPEDARDKPTNCFWGQS